MRDLERLAADLARGLAAGTFTEEDLAGRCTAMFGQHSPMITPLARALVEQFGTVARPRRDVLEALVWRFIREFRRRHKHRPKADRKKLHAKLLAPLAFDVVMAPAPRAKLWKVPPLCTGPELTSFLGLADETDESPLEAQGRLDWFADLRALNGPAGRSFLRHYHYRPLTKRFHTYRMIEAPKPRLKAIQRRILRDILERVPPHDAAHGFRKGRSLHTFAAPHVGRSIVIRIDLRDFFVSVCAEQVATLYRFLGYPESIADQLTGLCTTRTPQDVWPAITETQDRDAYWLACKRHETRHLPQGAPTSPYLANLCAYGLDVRLTGLAHTYGARYTRYADDLAFSSGRSLTRASSLKSFLQGVRAAVHDERFTIHEEKTRIMRAHQRQELAGLVLNAKPNVERRSFEQLKAILTNCMRHGPMSQNRARHPRFREHLQGRIAFVTAVHPARGAKLKALFQQIDWSVP